jgi:hypothetical protein
LYEEWLYVENETDQKFKKDLIKKTVKDRVQENINTIESQTGKPLPKEFVKLFDDVIEEMTPSSEKEALTFIKEFPEDLKEYLRTFQKGSEGLDPNCKDFLDKMVLDLFKVTTGKGIENGIWNHFSKIWYYFQVVNQMDHTKISKDSLEKDFFQLSFLYISLYELTLQILTEYALVIASKKKNHDRHSKTFLNQYSRELSKGRTIGKGDLVAFLKKENYLSCRSCNVLENAKFRNKPAHADAYFNSDTKKMVIGKENFEIQEIMDLWEELKRFYCYLVYLNLNQPSMQTMIAQLEEIANKIPEPLEP